jgi:predicted RNase H-like HicB family nuclease
MLIEYIEEALHRAKYEIIEDEEPFYGEVSSLSGVWATGSTLESCRENLQEAIESWLLISLKKDLPIPVIGDKKIELPEAV